MRSDWTKKTRDNLSRRARRAVELSVAERRASRVLERIQRRIMVHTQAHTSIPVELLAEEQAAWEAFRAIASLTA